MQSPVPHPLIARKEGSGDHAYSELECGRMHVSYIIKRNQCLQAAHVDLSNVCTSDVWHTKIGATCQLHVRLLSKGSGSYNDNSLDLGHYLATHAQYPRNRRRSSQVLLKYFMRACAFVHAQRMT